MSGFLIGIPLLSLTILIDSTFYNKFTFPAVNFFNINLLMDVSSMFGEEPWHYFLTFAMKDFLKVYYLIAIPAFLYFTISRLRKREFPEISLMIVFYLLVLSLIKHKE